MKLAKIVNKINIAIMNILGKNKPKIDIDKQYQMARQIEDKLSLYKGRNIDGYY